MSSNASLQAAQPDPSSATLVGCLLDVSGSMKNVIETGKGDRRAVERLSAVLRAALKLARSEQRQNPSALMFVGVFGVNDDRTPVVDLLGIVHALLQASASLAEAVSGEAFRLASAALNQLGGILGTSFARNSVTGSSRAVELARKIVRERLPDFKDLVPRPIMDVVSLLKRLEECPSFNSSISTDVVSGNADILLDELRLHLYGGTPMVEAMQKSLEAFNKHNDIKQRALVIISDGVSTDGDPLPLARKLKDSDVDIATIFLTDDNKIPRRQLYDKPPRRWFKSGQRTLFKIASTVAAAKHPIPVLSSMGWTVPLSGECALYATVCSTDTLEEFCSLLLTAQFGSTDALLDLVGHVKLDSFIDDEHVRTRDNPSDQGQSGTCYAHASAAVLHMALVRIVGREGGCPTIPEIRNRILKEFPPGPYGRSVGEVMERAVTWYRPLQVRQVDEEGARQALIRRRPVLTTFRLSKSGWKAFGKYFTNPTTRDTVLSASDMMLHRSFSDDGGHAVVLVKCGSRSLTFLNSWGHEWGDKGSFSIEKPAVLEVNNASKWNRVCFFDIFWYEKDLTPLERMAYDAKIIEEVKNRAAKHPSLLELEVQCPHCKSMAPIADYTGNIRQASCPHCQQSFTPEAGYLVQALYARAGLSGTV